MNYAIEQQVKLSRKFGLDPSLNGDYRHFLVDWMEENVITPSQERSPKFPDPDSKEFAEWKKAEKVKTKINKLRYDVRVLQLLVIVMTGYVLFTTLKDLF